jgi:hypothetical protein
LFAPSAIFCRINGIAIRFFKTRALLIIAARIPTVPKSTRLFLNPDVLPAGAELRPGEMQDFVEHDRRFPKFE